PGEDPAGGPAGPPPLRDRSVEQPEQVARRIDGGDALLGGSRHVPVAAEAETAVVQDRYVRRRQLAHAAKDGAGRRHVLAGQILDERLVVELASNASVREEGLELGA